MREIKHVISNNQRGMYAKCNITAGTKLVVSKPIAVCWDGYAECDQYSDGSDYESYYDEDDNDDYTCERSASDFVSEMTYTDPRLKEVCFQDEDGNLDHLAMHKYMKELKEQDKKDKKAEAEGRLGRKLAISSDNNISKRNGILILNILEKIRETPTLWDDTLSKLFPRDTDTPFWNCYDDTIRRKIGSRLNKLTSLSFFGSGNEDRNSENYCTEIADRLPLIVQYNALSIKTSSELYTYPAVMKGLAGSGLYGPEIS